MPRSSRHKSSKHSSGDARDLSDYERDSGVKDRKDSTRESSVRASKELASDEKRKLDWKENKEPFGSGNGEHSEEYAYSKRRKEKLDDSANDRWNGGGQDERGEIKPKASSDSRSTKRRDESVGVYNDGEESGKKNNGKIDGKHRESSRKVGERDKDREKDKDKDRERKGKDGKSARLVDGEDHLSVTRQVTGKTESLTQDLLQSPEMENQFKRRIKRKRDCSDDGDKHQGDVRDVNGRCQSSKDDITKDRRLKDEKHKDERYRDNYREDVDKDNKQLDEKQRDENITREHVCSRSDEKYLRDGKDTTEIRQKKSKTQETDHDREHDDDRDRDDLVWDYDLDRNDYHELERVRDHDCGRDKDRDRNHAHGRGRDRDHEPECDRDRDGEYERDVDHDGYHLDDRSARYKDNWSKKRYSDDLDDDKSKGLKPPYHEVEKKSLSSGRVEPYTDRGRSQARQSHQKATMGDSRRRSSPSSSSHGVPDEYRHFKSEDSKYRDGGRRTDFSGLSGASKNRSSERPVKPDDGYMGEFSAERPSSSKASPIGLVNRSFSPTSLEHKYMSRTGYRQGLDIEESGRRSSASMSARESSLAEDRFGRHLPLVDGSPQADSSFYSRTSQGISSFVTPPTTYRGGVGSPSFLGSLEEDTRVANGAHYRRNSDPNLARVPGNAWRVLPNWSSPVPNGIIPFQHRPPHEGFQTMMSQFSSPPMFGVRPSMDINPSGIPYPFPDDRFSGHLRPLGWQNMLDGSGPPCLHGWDGSNAVYRDEPRMYGGPDWDQNRHHVNGRAWESSGDAWKGQNGDLSMDLPSMSQKEDLPMQSMVDVHTGQAGQKLQHENNHGTVKPTETASIVTSPSKDMPKSSPKVTHEKSSDLTKTSNEDGLTQFCRAYLSKVDISTGLTDPELYDQCMAILNIEQNGTADRETNILVSLKDGGRAISKSSSIILGLKLLPAADDSVFQRAMDLYKKQRVNLSALENVCGGALDSISASNLEKMEEPVNVCNVERVEEPNSILDTAMQDAPDEDKADTVAAAAPEDKLEEPVPIYDSTLLEVHNQEKAEANALSAEDKLEEPASTPSQVVQDQVTHTPDKLLVSDDGSPVEPVQNLSGEREDWSTTEQANREDARGDFIVTSDNTSCATPVLVTDSKGKKEISKGEASGDAVRGPLPLFVSDGSPNASGVLLPGSNKLVIVSRIHHSPESTH